MNPVIQRIEAIRPLTTGEGPFWKPASQDLYMVDVSGQIIKYNPAKNETVYNKIGEHSPFIIPVRGRDDEFVTAIRLQLLRIKWDTATNQILEREVLADLSDREQEGAQINDAECDSQGRLWFGTLGKVYTEEQGSMYSYTKSEGVVKQVSNVRVSNGLAFSSDGKKLFYVDSMSKTVSQYDVTSGVCKLDKVVLHYENDKVEGLPDGLTTDADDKLWIASIFSSQVIRVDPGTGKILNTIRIEESPQPTSVSWGGPNLDELYITTANIKFPGYEHTCVGSGLGATYRVTGLGVKGRPQNEFNIDL